MGYVKKGRSIVTVTFIDGELKDYPMSASPSIATWLMQQGGATGFLTLRDDDAKSSVCIPVSQIREISVRAEDGESSE